ncbi:MAG: signal peptidase II [Gemmatimonadota bacterium]|nr:signal peptidase II [Gemmatimonadota bacterium]
MTDAAPPDGKSPSKVPLTAITMSVVLALDVVTKQWIVDNMPLYSQRNVWGDFFRFTYTHNPGAAFGIDIGEHSRIFFLVLSLIALGVLFSIYRQTPAWDRLRVLALSLVAGGALGNILDRIRYEAGVVDFLDFGIGTSRFAVFNIADSAVTVGAALLLISFWLEGRREREAEKAAEAEGSSGGLGRRAEPEPAD